jgi:UDP-2,3-diacylglucosamine pyrophosphatase LpxH
MKTASIVIISDIHLRSENCQAKLLLNTLREYDYETLIINGDLIEDDRVHPDNIKMNWRQFQLIEYMRARLRKKNTAKKIIRIGGNHDFSGHDFINQILGIETLLEYRWEMNGKKFCTIHGHQFDRFVFKNPLLSKFISNITLFLQKIDSRKRYLTRMIDRFHTKWFRLTEIVAHDAIEFARREGIDVIICGHTHEGMQRVFTEDGRTIEYWNSGDWTGHRCSFITIDEKGVIELHFFMNPPSPINQNVNNSDNSLSSLC